LLRQELFCTLTRLFRSSPSLPGLLLELLIFAPGFLNFRASGYLRLIFIPRLLLSLRTSVDYL